MTFSKLFTTFLIPAAALCVAVQARAEGDSDAFLYGLQPAPVPPPPPNLLGFLKPEHPVVFRTIPDGEPPAVYGPHPAHLIAHECEENDAQCVADHDERASWAARMFRSEAPCDDSTAPVVCKAELHFELDDVPLPPPDPYVSGPCTLVVRIEGTTATLYTPATRTTRKAPADPRMKEASFFGDCGGASLAVVSAARVSR